MVDLTNMGPKYNDDLASQAWAAKDYLAEMHAFVVHVSTMLLYSAAAVQCLRVCPSCPASEQMELTALRS